MLKYHIILFVFGLLFTTTVNASSCHGAGQGATMDMQGDHKEHVQQQTTQPPIQTICPIMGGSVDRTIFADWQGNELNTPKRVYFCCNGCIEKFNQKPEKYVNKLRKMGRSIENIIE